MDIYSAVRFNNINVTVHMARHAIIDRKRHNAESSPFTRIYVVKEGQGTLRCKDQVFPFVGGNIYILPAEIEHTLETNYFEKVYFHISVPTQEAYDLLGKLDRIYALPCLEDEYETLYRLLMSDSYYDKIKLKMCILSILVRLYDTYPLPPANIRQRSDLVKNILVYIQINLKSTLRASDIAEHYHVSESHIRNAFRKEMGLPIGKYIDELVFAKAKELLSSSSLKISQISAILGFCDQFYFSQSFKKRFWITPSQFRKQNSMKTS